MRRKGRRGERGGVGGAKGEGRLARGGVEPRARWARELHSQGPQIPPYPHSHVTAQERSHFLPSTLSQPQCHVSTHWEPSHTAQNMPPLSSLLPTPYPSRPTPSPLPQPQLTYSNRAGAHHPSPSLASHPTPYVSPAGGPAPQHSSHFSGAHHPSSSIAFQQRHHFSSGAELATQTRPRSAEAPQFEPRLKQEEWREQKPQQRQGQGQGQGQRQGLGQGHGEGQRQGELQGLGRESEDADGRPSSPWPQTLPG